MICGRSKHVGVLVNHIYIYIYIYVCVCVCVCVCARACVRACERVLFNPCTFVGIIYQIG